MFHHRGLIASLTVSKSPLTVQQPYRSCPVPLISVANVKAQHDKFLLDLRDAHGGRIVLVNAEPNWIMLQSTSIRSHQAPPHAIPRYMQVCSGSKRSVREKRRVALVQKDFKVFFIDLLL